ncbi:hypothetical protein ABBQ32_008556 [Trebouxia sp. C0010 RCD-2024]
MSLSSLLHSDNPDDLLTQKPLSQQDLFDNDNVWADWQLPPLSQQSLQACSESKPDESGFDMSIFEGLSQQELDQLDKMEEQFQQLRRTSLGADAPEIVDLDCEEEPAEPEHEDDQQVR